VHGGRRDRAGNMSKCNGGIRGRLAEEREVTMYNIDVIIKLFLIRKR